ncbi:MCP-domain signal transduction protein [Malaciobacter mytili LMG 24559]|nr:methyl-accepting chemotaxis protein [Malaciobacter mytili]AXH15148.1 MCP-domain signal transduction protein [Malaciobacter mytili LMG 24559]
MRDISIKFKLLISFLLISILVLTIISYSIYGISKAAKGFKQFQSISFTSDIADNIQTSMLLTRMSVKEYLYNSKEYNMSEFNKYYKTSEDLAKQLASNLSNEKEKALVKSLLENIEVYKINFFELVDYEDEKNRIIENNLVINGAKIEKLLDEITTITENENQLKQSLQTTKATKNLLMGRFFALKYVSSNNKNDNFKVIKEFEKLEKELKLLNLQNEDLKTKQKQTLYLINEYKKGLNKLIFIIDNKNSFVKELHRVGPQIANLAVEIKNELSTSHNILKEQIENTNNSLTYTIEIISAIILSIIILLAIYIPKNINHQILEFQEGLLNFFKYLNRQTNTAELLKNSSKTEIGLMSKVVNENILKTKASIEEDRKIINETVQVLSEFQQGDLCQRITTKVSNPALNQLKEVLNNMGETLENNIENILEVLEQFSKYNYLNKVNTTGIKKHLEKLANGVNELGTSITSMLIENKANGLTLENSSSILLQNVDTLNTSANEAATSLEQTAAALEEITGNITLTTNKILQIDSLTKELTNSTNIGENLAIKTTSSMEDINAQVTAINEAITVIDQIAFQTNILSLNAAVEAATAGEAGRGFSVVAQEVRNLASRSAQAAKEIKELVENATIKANEGKNIASDMINGYNSLKQNINQATELIYDVSNASKEQKIGILQINDAINNLDTQTQKNATTATQTQEVAINTLTIAKKIVENANSKEFKDKDIVKAKEFKNIQKNIETKILDDKTWESF